MYSHLLASALAIDETSDDEPTTSAAVDHLRRCRSRFGGSRWSPSRAEGGYVTLINNLAYDAALITVARRMGVDCGAEEYDQPAKARARLEAILAGRGIPLDEIEPSTRLTGQP